MHISCRHKFLISNLGNHPRRLYKSKCSCFCHSKFIFYEYTISRMVCSYCDGKAKPAHGNCRTCPKLHADRLATQAAEGVAKHVVCGMIDTTLPGAGEVLGAIDQAYDAISSCVNWSHMSKNEKKEFFARNFFGAMMC